MKKQDKLQAIFRKAPTDSRSLLQLLALGRHKGFQTLINRKLIWPFLLNIQYDKLSQTPLFEWKGQIDRNSLDYQQIQKDAQRSLSSMKTFENINKIHLKKRQDDVLVVLDNFFTHNQGLRYVQGFHDVTSVFLTIFGNNIGYYMLEQTGKVYFYDILKFDVGHIGMTLSSIVYDLIIHQDQDFQEIFHCFKQSKFLTFIIPWIFTWFAHVFSSLKTICRIWDYILCTGPFGVVYLTAGIILSTKAELLEHCQQFDQANIHTFYQILVKNESLNIQKAIQKAIQLQETINIRELSGYKDFKQDSMFVIENFQKKLDIIKKHNQYLQLKKRGQKFQNIKRTAVYISIVIASVAIGTIFYKNNAWKYLKVFGEM